jgi:AGCS family alanine or glycine:cation symporter
MASVFGAPHWVTGLVLAATIGAVILGGIQRIGAVASALVPLMAFVYVACSLVILALRADALPEAFRLVLTHALTPSAASGGVVGATVATAMRFGVARGVFSNEAGLGTAGIAQAAGTTRSAVRSGLIGMLGTFIDTIIVCTMTGLVIISTGVWKSGKTGAALTSAAFERALPGVGGYLLALSLVLFAYTTMLGWAYYGERCWEFMLGERATRPFRVLWTIVAGVGAVMGLDLVWLIADTLNAMMAIPNLVSLVVLSPVVVRLTREYFATQAVPAVQGAIE